MEKVRDGLDEAGTHPAQDRAWGVLLGACLCMFCGTSSVIYYTFGVFLPEIIADTGWSAASVAAAIGPGALIVALGAPLIGWASDRFGARPLAIVGGPAFGLGIALLGIGSTSSLGFVLLTALMYLFAPAGMPILYAQALTGWFDRRRGLALSVMFCAGALGIAAWGPYAALLIAHLGWRQAYVVIGSTAGLIIFLSGLFLLRSAPRRNGDAASATGSAPGLLVGEAIRTRRFWTIAAIFALLSIVLGGTAVQFPVILRKAGADAQTAASIMSVIGLFMFLGRAGLGLVLDRWFAPHVTIGITVVSLFAFALLLGGSGASMMIAAAACLGFGLGSEYAIAAYITSRAFGFGSFGAIYGLVSLATGVGLAAGPAAIGAALVTGISEKLIFGSSVVLLLLSIGLLFTLRRTDLPFGTAAR